MFGVWYLYNWALFESDITFTDGIQGEDMQKKCEYHHKHHVEKKI